MSWLRFDWYDFQHVLPEDELEDHSPKNCICNPEYNEEYSLFVHNSFDNRESYENGRKMN